MYSLDSYSQLFQCGRMTAVNRVWISKEKYRSMNENLMMMQNEWFRYMSPVHFFRKIAMLNVESSKNYPTFNIT